jgi:hypothetical protein
MSPQLHRGPGAAVQPVHTGEHFDKHKVAHVTHPEEGLPGYHDPTSGIGGSTQAISALTARLVLAIIGVAIGVIAGVTFILADAPIGLTVLMFVLGGLAGVDIMVVTRRKRRGEPG